MARRSCFFAAALSIGDLARGFNFVAPSTGVRVTSELGNKRWVTPPSAPRRSSLNVPLQAVAQDATSRTVPILVTGNNVEVTEPLKEYIEKKMTSVLDKVGSSVSKVDVHLTVNKNPRVSENHNTEVTVFSKNHVIRATDTSDNMYACVDLVADRIRRKLRRFKERKVSETRNRPGVGGLSEQVVAAAQDSAEPVETEEDPFEDKYGEPEVVVDMSLVKSKSFPMPPINVDEAVMCLDYIDHDFYLFRNAETNEVNVVYKRNSGGVGLIQPDAKK